MSKYFTHWVQDVMLIVQNPAFGTNFEYLFLKFLK